MNKGFNLEKACIGLFIILFLFICNKMFEGNRVEGMNKQIGECCWPGECSEGLSCSLLPFNWKDDRLGKKECTYEGAAFFSGIGMCI